MYGGSQLGWDAGAGGGGGLPTGVAGLAGAVCAPPAEAGGETEGRGGAGATLAAGMGGGTAGATVGAGSALPVADAGGGGADTAARSGGGTGLGLVST